MQNMHDRKPWTSDAARRPQQLATRLANALTRGDMELGLENDRSRQPQNPLSRELQALASVDALPGSPRFHAQERMADHLDCTIEELRQAALNLMPLLGPLHPPRKTRLVREALDIPTIYLDYRPLRPVADAVESIVWDQLAEVLR